MTAGRTRALRTVRDLREFIAALDRRIPQVERSGEASISRAATTLRNAATTRVADLERALTKHS